MFSVPALPSRATLHAALFLLLGCIASAFAQGVITGRVSNATTSAYLEGAEVSVIGRVGTVLTGRDGSFTLTDVPAGAQQVRIHYTGLAAMAKARTRGEFCRLLYETAGSAEARRP